MPDHRQTSIVSYLQAQSRGVNHIGRLAVQTCLHRISYRVSVLAPFALTFCCMHAPVLTVSPVGPDLSSLQCRAFANYRLWKVAPY